MKTIRNIYLELWKENILVYGKMENNKRKLK
jgi:hypothetical protein